MRVHRYDRAIKDDNGSKELVDLRNRNTFIVFYIGPDKCIYVSLVVLLALVRGKVFVRITVHYPAQGHYFNYSNSDRPSPRTYTM